MKPSAVLCTLRLTAVATTRTSTSPLRRTGRGQSSATRRRSSGLKASSTTAFMLVAGILQPADGQEESVDIIKCVGVSERCVVCCNPQKAALRVFRDLTTLTTVHAPAGHAPAGCLRQAEEQGKRLPSRQLQSSEARLAGAGDYERN